MLIEKFIVGQCIKFKDQNLLLQNRVVGPGTFRADPHVLLSIGLSKDKGQGAGQTSKIGPLGDTQDRNFQWLSYSPGYLSYVSLNAYDVLTGPMSGCPIVLYKEGAHTYVGHVGTVVGYDDENQSLYDAWYAKIKTPGVTFVSSFNPLRHSQPQNLTNQHHWADISLAPSIFALVTKNTHELYTIITFPVMDPQTKQGTGALRIAAVERMSKRGLQLETVKFKKAT